MDVASATSSAAATASQASSSQKQLSTNFDTFLTLLTTQLQNQDPLSPMDSNQFTQQLVQFSQVEQQINSNQNLETLISLAKGRSSADAVSYLGKTITMTDGSGALQHGSALWAYSLNGDAANTTVTVSNSGGKVVYVGKGEATSGMHSFTWNGQDNAGNQMPDGTYTLSVASQTAAGTSVATHVASQGVVSEIDLTGSEPQLMVGPMGVPISKAQLVSSN